MEWYLWLWLVTILGLMVTVICQNYNLKDKCKKLEQAYSELEVRMHDIAKRFEFKETWVKFVCKHGIEMGTLKETNLPCLSPVSVLFKDRVYTYEKHEEYTWARIYRSKECDHK